MACFVCDILGGSQISVLMLERRIRQRYSKRPPVFLNFLVCSYSDNPPIFGSFILLFSKKYHRISTSFALASQYAPTRLRIEWTSRSAVAFWVYAFLESSRFAFLMDEISNFQHCFTHFGRLPLLTIATTRSHGHNSIFVTNLWCKAFGSARFDSVEIENQLRKMRFGAIF